MPEVVAFDCVCSLRLMRHAAVFGDLFLSARIANRNPEIRVRPEVCQVAMVYEDPATRDYAIQLCDSLSRKFQDDLEFEFTWWGFKYLSDPEIAQQASRAAAEADLIVVCVHRSGFFPS